MSYRAFTVEEANALRHGLVDFPTTYEGRWVYLCWKRGSRSWRRGTRWTAASGVAGRSPTTSGG